MIQLFFALALVCGGLQAQAAANDDAAPPPAGAEPLPEYGPGEAPRPEEERASAWTDGSREDVPPAPAVSGAAVRRGAFGRGVGGVVAALPLVILNGALGVVATVGLLIVPAFISLILPFIGLRIGLNMYEAAPPVETDGSQSAYDRIGLIVFGAILGVAAWVGAQALILVGWSFASSGLGVLGAGTAWLATRIARNSLRQPPSPSGTEVAGRAWLPAAFVALGGTLVQSVLAPLVVVAGVWSFWALYGSLKLDASGQFSPTNLSDPGVVARYTILAFVLPGTLLITCIPFFTLPVACGLTLGGAGVTTVLAGDAVDAP